MALGGLLVSLWINYHWYLPDFNMVAGDRGDTRLVVFTLEHWFRAFQGLEPFLRLQMFYPDPNALAYADGLFLFGLPYAALRAIGSGPLQQLPGAAGAPDGDRVRGMDAACCAAT
jgi:hypothetical protein